MTQDQKKPTIDKEALLRRCVYLYSRNPTRALAKTIRKLKSEIRSPNRKPRQRRARKAKRYKQSYSAFIEFYESKEWKELRYKAILTHGRICQCCGATDKPIHVDHIKPRAKYPSLELNLENLQILCENCNIGKGGWDETDWR